MNSNIELFGRKTFFFAADDVLIPGACLERLMKHGFEAYLVEDNASAPLEDKVQSVIRLFPDAILFFNIDASVRGINWNQFIRDLVASGAGNVLVGVVYKKRSPEEDARLKAFYERELRVTAGCLMLDSGEEGIFQSVREVLARNGAPCSARLLDINVTHFLCDMRGQVTPMPVFQKIKGATLHINDLDLQSNAVLIMKRQSVESNLCIFMFIKEDDTPDLDRESVIRLNKKIYEIVTNKNMSLLKSAFMGRDN